MLIIYKKTLKKYPSNHKLVLFLQKKQKNHTSLAQNHTSNILSFHWSSREQAFQELEGGIFHPDYCLFTVLSCQCEVMGTGLSQLLWSWLNNKPEMLSSFTTEPWTLINPPAFLGVPTMCRPLEKQVTSLFLIPSLGIF